MKKKNRSVLFVQYLLLVSFTLLCLFPIFWLVNTSFKTNSELFGSPWALPSSLSFENYRNAFVIGNLLLYFYNSTVISFFAVLVGLVLSSMASYAIARMKWKLSKLTLSVFLLGMMIPVYATIIPLFSMFNRMGILNHHLAVIIPQVVMGFPIAIYIMAGFMGSFSREIEEAAVIDGCNIFQIFFLIIVPIIQSCLVTVAVVLFINTWNDLLLPQIFLTDSSKMTLPVGLTAFQGQYSTDYVSMIAAVVISIIPSILLYVLLHRNIMEGMTAGAVKG
jgi:raffinose/stachyose/melibiose transport system permease protein